MYSTAQHIEIGTTDNGCCHTEFDSAYPIHLNGIIGPAEFHQSIENVNIAMSSDAWNILWGLCMGVFVIIGLGLFIGGGLTAMRSETSGFSPIIGAGIAFTVCGFIIAACGYQLIKCRKESKIRDAINIESRKYSQRMPIPCSWRLKSSYIPYGNYDNHQFYTVYSIIIEIGNPIVQARRSSQVCPEPIFYSPPIEIVSPAPPPPYNEYIVAASCSYCGMPRQNSTSKFCSSCGQSAFVL